MDRVKLLAKLLPQLDFFHSFIDEWTSEGLIHVIDQLRTNDTVVDVCLRLPCELMISDRKVADALIRCIKENQKIQRLTLLGTRRGKRGEVVDDTYFNDFFHAIACNPRIEDLNLSDFTLKNGEKLNSHLTTGKAPKTLTFTDFTVNDPWDFKTAPRKHSCITEHLTFSYCNLYTPWFQGFLAQLCYIPSIKELNLLNSTSEHNVTNLLDHCLELGRLETIKVTGYTVATRRFAKALETNKTLTSFQVDHAVNMEWKRKELARVLRDHNTSIQHVELTDQVAKSGPGGQQIMYHAMLNKYGRGNVRTVKCRSQLREILDDVNADADMQDFEKQCTLYGLLRECPSTWSKGNFADDPIVRGSGNKPIDFSRYGVGLNRKPVIIDT
jgi:hypothetical protein